MMSLITLSTQLDLKRIPILAAKSHKLLALGPGQLILRKNFIWSKHQKIQNYYNDIGKFKVLIVYFLYMLM